MSRSMPISLYDPSTQATRTLARGEAPAPACADTSGGPAQLGELRHAVISDVLQRLLPAHKVQASGALAASLNRLSRDDLRDACEPEALRFFLLTAHYRAPLPLTPDREPVAGVEYPQLDDSERRLAYLYAAKRRFLELPPERIIAVQTAPASSLATLPDALTQALENDLDTPLALAEVQEFAIAINALCDAALRKKGHVNASAVESVQAGLSTIAGLLGIGGETPSAFLLRVRNRRARRLGIDVAAVDATVARRSAARLAKDFVTGDRLQAELLARGISLLDGVQGTSWTLG
jgi:cysteinyl-tRNA synthetase